MYSVDATGAGCAANDVTCDGTVAAAWRDLASPATMLALRWTQGTRKLRPGAGGFVGSPTGKHQQIHRECSGGGIPSLRKRHQTEFKIIECHILFSGSYAATVKDGVLND